LREGQVVRAIGDAIVGLDVHRECDDHDREVNDDRCAKDHRQPRIEAIGERATHAGRQHRLGLTRRLGDKLKQDRQITERQLAACGVAERHAPVAVVVGRAARLERVERVDLVTSAEPAIHLVEKSEVVLLVLEREQRQLERQPLDRDREGILHRLTDGDRRALADETLLDDLATEQHADTQDALARPAVLRLAPVGSLRGRRH
jgi:hypothetical protein